MRARMKVMLGLAGTGAVALIVAGVGHGVQERERRIRVGRDTTFVTGPLNADGYVDYPAALDEEYRRGVTVANNAAVPLLPAFGRGRLGGQEYRDHWLKQIGVATAPEQGSMVPLDVVKKEWEAAHAGPATEVVSSEERTETEEAREKTREELPWVEKDDPLFTEWVARNEGAIRCLYEASMREHLYLPVIFRSESVLVDAIMPGLGASRELVNVACARAMLRLGKGDVKGWSADVMAVERLGRLMTHGPTILHYLVGLAILRKAEACVAGGLGRIDAVDAHRLLKDLQASPEPRTSADMVDRAERLEMLSELSGMAQYGNSWRDEPVKMKGEQLGFGVTPVNFNELMRLANELYDDRVAMCRSETYSELAGRVRDYSKKMHGIENLAKNAWDPGVKRCYAMFTLMGGEGKERMLESELQMRMGQSRLGLMLEVYRNEHGEYPASLEKLPQKGKQDFDFYAGGPMVYRREGNGYVLYSVGRNLVNDGGVWEDYSAYIKRTGSSEGRKDDVVLQVDRGGEGRKTSE